MAINRDANFAVTTATASSKLAVLLLRSVLSHVSIRTHHQDKHVIAFKMEMIVNEQQLTAEFFLDRIVEAQAVMPPIDLMVYNVCNYLHDMYLKSNHPALSPDALARFMQ